MKKLFIGVIVIGFAIWNNHIGLSQIEQGISTLITISLFVLLELVSINEKIDKWK